MMPVNNNRSNVWSAVGKGATIGAATGAVMNIGATKLAAKYPDQFVKAFKCGNMTWGYDMLKSLFKNAKVKPSAVIESAGKGAIVFGAVAALGYGIKSLFKGKKNAAEV